MTGWIIDLARRFGPKRLVALALGGGFLSLAFDAAVGHVADAVVEEPSQVVAIVVPLLSSLALLGVAIPRVGARWFGRVCASVGWVSVVTGAAGTFFHVEGFLEQFKDAEEITFTLVRESLGVSPPIFAPAAFLGVGGLLVVLAHARLRVEADAAAPKEPAGAVEPAKA